MRKVKIEKWKAKDRDGKEYDETLLTVFNVLLNNQDPKEAPRGFDKSRLFNKIIKAFEKADKSGELVLEDAEYKFLKELVEKDMPSVWGANHNIFKAVESFMEAKEESA